MPAVRKGEKSGCDEGEFLFSHRLMSTFLMIAGPLFIVFVNLRCEKNQCVLLQLPMVFPTHMNAYFSKFAAGLLASFLVIMFASNKLSINEAKRGRNKEISPNGALMSPTLACHLALSLLLVCIAYLRPDYILKVRSEYLRLICTTLAFSIIFSLVVTLLCRTKLIRKERDFCLPMAFFHGETTKLKFSMVNLKYFFYVNAGLVAWALVDLLIFVSYVLEKPVTAPMIFIFTTQYIFVLHTLMFEKFLADRPFMYTEGLGFSWLLRVLLVIPFIYSVPLLYAADTDVSIPKPAMLANCGLFMFGFVIYVSSLHQKETFSVTRGSPKNMKTISTSFGKRLLAGGYWGTVQKPDYLGYLIIWLSWTVACGFSPVAVIILMLVCASILFWLQQRDTFLREKNGSAWTRYTSAVPHKIIPMVY